MKKYILLFCIVIFFSTSCEKKITPIELFSFELNGKVYNADIYKNVTVIVNEHWKSQSDFDSYYIIFNNPESSVATFVFELQDSTYGINPIFYIEDGYDVASFGMTIQAIDPNKHYRAIKGYLTFNHDGDFKDIVSRTVYSKTVVSGEFDIYMVCYENETDTIHLTNGKYAFNSLGYYAPDKP